VAACYPGPVAAVPGTTESTSVVIRCLPHISLRRWAVAGAAILLAAPLLALDPSRPVRDCRLRSWTVRDGLPQNSVTSIVQDGQGYLWVATFGGLARFNGRRFESYPSAEWEEGRGVDRATALLVDGEGSLWVGMEEGGLARLTEAGFRAVRVARTPRRTTWPH